MYHILASQRQAQFGAGQAFDYRAVQFQPVGGSVAQILLIRLALALGAGALLTRLLPRTG